MKKRNNTAASSSKSTTSVTLPDMEVPAEFRAAPYHDEEDSPHYGQLGDITQLTEKPVRVKKKKNKIGFY